MRGRHPGPRPQARHHPRRARLLRRPLRPGGHRHRHPVALDRGAAVGGRHRGADRDDPRGGREGDLRRELGQPEGRGGDRARGRRASGGRAVGRLARPARLERRHLPALDRRQHPRDRRRARRPARARCPPDLARAVRHAVHAARAARDAAARRARRRARLLDRPAPARLLHPRHGDRDVPGPRRRRPLGRPGAGGGARDRPRLRGGGRATRPPRRRRGRDRAPARRRAGARRSCWPATCSSRAPASTGCCSAARWPSAIATCGSPPGRWRRCWVSTRALRRAWLAGGFDPVAAPLARRPDGGRRPPAAGRRRGRRGRRPRRRRLPARDRVLVDPGGHRAARGAPTCGRSGSAPSASAAAEAVAGLWLADRLNVGPGPALAVLASTVFAAVALATRWR